MADADADEILIQDVTTAVEREEAAARMEADSPGDSGEDSGEATEEDEDSLAGGGVKSKSSSSSARNKSYSSSSSAKNKSYSSSPSVAAASSDEEEEESEETVGSMVQAPGSPREAMSSTISGTEVTSEEATAGVGVSNTTTSVTTIIDHSKDPAVIADRVKQFLTCYPRHVGKEPSEFACVFDVDETLLYTLEDTKQVGLQPLGRVIYDFCKEQGFFMVLITARTGDPASLKYLQDQLAALDYTGYDEIYMVNVEHKYDNSPAICKYNSRMDLNKEVILNIGNRLTDLFVRDQDEDPLLCGLNPQTYYCLKGEAPDVLCVKLPRD